MRSSGQSTVIFVHSTAHWEAIQQQRTQLLNDRSSEPLSSSSVSSLPHAEKRKNDNSTTTAAKVRSTFGREGSRRRRRWINNNFLDHPTAVLYAEDSRPPNFENFSRNNHLDAAVINQILLADQVDDDTMVMIGNEPTTTTILTKHIRHDLKRLRIPESMLAHYESQLVQFINAWLDDVECLDKACFKVHVVSDNRFERYILHTMSRYYGLNSYSKENDQNHRITYICHPVYVNYFTKGHAIDSIDFDLAADWVMPDQSFLEYLYAKK